MWIVLVVTIAAVTGSLAFLAGRFTSPAQQAAQAQAPEPSVLTISVEQRVLRDVVVGRGRAVRTAGTSLNLPPVQFDDKRSIVTDVFVKPGSVLANGSLVASVADEPLFVLTGGFDPYRDLYRDDRGQDVEEIQRALNERGESLEVDGILGPLTEAAVHRYLAGIGYLDRLDALNKEREDTAQVPVEAVAVEGDTSTAKPPALVLPSVWWFAASELPATLTDVELRVGDDLATQGSSLTFEGSGLLVDVRLDEGSVGLITEGMTCRIGYDDSDTEFGLSVSSLRPALDASGETESGRVLFEPSDTSHLREGEPFRIEFVLLETEPVMAVPACAIQSGADGNPAVVVDRQGVASEISVTVGRQADGWVEITPLDEGSLEPGDQVIIR